MEQYTVDDLRKGLPSPGECTEAEYKVFEFLESTGADYTWLAHGEKFAVSDYDEVCRALDIKIIRNIFLGLNLFQIIYNCLYIRIFLSFTQSILTALVEVSGIQKEDAVFLPPAVSSEGPRRIRETLRKDLFCTLSLSCFSGIRISLPEPR